MGMRVLKTIGNRVYADFLMPDRLAGYRELLETALAQGFHVLSVPAFWEQFQRGLAPGQRYMVLRHDIDTDSATAARMWAIASELGVAPSFYFRLTTLDFDLMDRIARGGGEASYHYEEIATVAKARGLKSRDEVVREMPRIQALFLSNLERLRRTSGLPMNVVASHGDFMNRKLHTFNWELLADPAFRHRAGIDLETYDAPLMAAIDRRFSDTGYPRHWLPNHPSTAFGTDERVVAVLLHPRHWRVSRVENAKDNAVRMWEGVRHALA